MYPTLKAVASWGNLEVEIEGGALLSVDRHKITIGAPTMKNGQRFEGGGWHLNLADGWKLVPSEINGNFKAQKCKSEKSNRSD